MKNMNSPTSVPVPQQSSHRDEVLMQQSLVFADNLKDLKNLREQLYSAAEYFAMAYTKEMQKQIVEDTLKDYAIKALVNTVDHLGSIAYKINTFLDEKINDYSVMELRLFCLEQSLVLEAPKHHKHYIFPGIQAKPADTPSERAGDGYFMLRSSRHFPRQRPQLLTSV
uniref:Protein ABIL3 n=1 Tax=Gossypium raimondii TaxID=29730 RepID=A0A0D2MH57_GOSRA|nr:hypothetical protein B456_003G074200 [Gossypium raimondii]